MDITNVINQVIIILLLIAVGFACRKFGMINQQTKKGIADILLVVSIPAATVNAFNNTFPREVLMDGLAIFIFGIIAHAATVLISRFIYARKPLGTRAVMSFVTVFSNCAFMGFPVMKSIFGDVGIFYASFYFMTFNIFLWTYGNMVFTGAAEKGAVRRAVLNTGTLAVVVSLILLLTPVKIPALGASVLNLLGSLTTPLAMLVIGATLAEVKLRTIFHGFAVYWLTALRLLILPAVAMVLLKIAGASHTAILAGTLLIGMPAASNTVMFAEKYDGDTILATRAVILSTVLSIVTIPLIVWLI